jgi:hypothetical protein
MSTPRRSLALSAITLLLAVGAVPSAIVASGFESASAPAVSDPDPVDCPFCAGNPAVHLRAVWTIQKSVARGLVQRFG